jgi:hypothetical protein
MRIGYGVICLINNHMSGGFNSLGFSINVYDVLGCGCETKKFPGACVIVKFMWSFVSFLQKHIASEHSELIGSWFLSC